MHKGACLLQGSPPFPSALRLARQCARAGRRLEVALELCLGGSCARLCCQILPGVGWGEASPVPVQGQAPGHFWKRATRSASANFILWPFCKTVFSPIKHVDYFNRLGPVLSFGGEGAIAVTLPP